MNRKKLNATVWEEDVYYIVALGLKNGKIGRMTKKFQIIAGIMEKEKYAESKRLV